MRTTFYSTGQRPQISRIPQPREARPGSAEELQSPSRSQIGWPDHSSEVSGQPIPSECSGLRLAGNVVLSPSLHELWLVVRMVDRIGCNILKKIPKLSDLGPFRASVPARSPLSHHSRPENGGANAHSISLPTLSLSRPCDSVCTACLGKPHMCRQHLPSGSPKGAEGNPPAGPEKQNRSNYSIVCIQTYACLEMSRCSGWGKSAQHCCG